VAATGVSSFLAFGCVFCMHGVTDPVPHLLKSSCTLCPTQQHDREQQFAAVLCFAVQDRTVHASFDDRELWNSCLSRMLMSICA